MRLDEWQKWLDSQFIEMEEAPPPPQEEEPNVTPQGYEEACSEQAAVPPPAYAAEVTPAEVYAQAQAYAPPAVPEQPVIAREAEPVQAQPAQQVVTPPVERKAEPQERAPAAASADLREDENAVPSIENYIPFLRSKHQTPAEKPVPDPPRALDQLPASQQAAQVTAFAQPDQSTETAGPSMDVLEEAEPPPPARRFGKPSHRSRRGKHLRAEQTPAPMAAEEVWDLVPRHLRSLVAMSGDEVTQNSYKRSFKESRIELIQRLLDPTLSLEETARLLNVCPTTVRRYTNRGLLRHQRTGGDQRRFKLSDVLTFLEAQSQTSPPQAR
jgi:excisionase family DNA binding protein